MEHSRQLQACPSQTLLEHSSTLAYAYVLPSLLCAWHFPALSNVFQSFLDIWRWHCPSIVALCLALSSNVQHLLEPSGHFWDIGVVIGIVQGFLETFRGVWARGVRATSGALQGLSDVIWKIGRVSIKFERDWNNLKSNEIVKCRFEVSSRLYV